MDPRLVTALVVVVGVPAVLVGYIVLDGAGCCGSSRTPARQVSGRGCGSLPALLFLSVFLVYPTIGTIVRSFQNSRGNDVRRPRQLRLVLHQHRHARSRSGTTLLWVVLLTAVDGRPRACSSRSSSTGSATSGRQGGDLPAARDQHGRGRRHLAVHVRVPAAGPAPGRDAQRHRRPCSASSPSPWLQVQTFGLNTILLIIVMAWMWTGFAMVILSAALKGISVELLEAARVDGATEWQVFRRIVFPLLLPTIAVVATTIVITALKAFDIVYVDDQRQLRHRQVIAPSMIKEMFNNGNFGRGERGGRHPAGRDRAGDAPQHPPLPRAGGDPMTAVAGVDR